MIDATRFWWSFFCIDSRLCRLTRKLHRSICLHRPNKIKKKMRPFLVKAKQKVCVCVPLSHPPLIHYANGQCTLDHTLVDDWLRQSIIWTMIQCKCWMLIVTWPKQIRLVSQFCWANDHLMLSLRWRQAPSPPPTHTHQYPVNNGFYHCVSLAHYRWRSVRQRRWTTPNPMNLVWGEIEFDSF